ncbi:hypothetical protein VNO80_28421 [Phaseolus coccineus]|uniref:RING-type domain-containing protein n=1 Tax=Phaseolus coccineus TaxID=3886 RepID=A0AAN9QDZ8_PHACN
MSRSLRSLVPIVLASFMSLCVIVCMLYDATATPTFITLSYIAGFLIWCYIVLSFFRRCREMLRQDYYGRSNSGDEGVESGDIEADYGIHSHHPSRRRAPIPLPRIRVNRETWQTIQLSSFTPRTTHTYRLAIKALPPAICFGEDQTKESQSDCSICLEEFKNGDFIQPFGVCLHEFHSSCLKSWLLSQKTSCPLCREELPILA